MKLSTGLTSLLTLIPLALAQSAEWGQCGGIGWAGPTTCVSGTVCTEVNAYYSQCLPGTAAPAPAPTSAPVGTQPVSTPSGGGATPTISGGFPGATSTASLNALAQSKGKKYFGSATQYSEITTDEAYTTLLSDSTMFGQLTPGNEMKWEFTEPEQGQFTFTQADAIVAFAKANGQIMRGHNCVWYQELPGWVTSDNFNATALTSVIQTHCGTIVSHYKGEIYAWDIINEPFNDDGTWRSDVFYNTLGQDFVSIALDAAASADPNAKLYINDYNIEGPGAKATSMQNLVSSLKSAGVTINGIGFESHFIVGELPSGIQTNMEAFTALGVEVAVTELDIRMTLPETTAQLEQQKTDYQTVISACNAVEDCVGVTVWDWTDKYSWVPSTFSGQGAACPWDDNFAKKPAFDGIVAGFQ